jgi:4-amino-4-deoxy-L-arabinose transferase-like glycosyltransferase
MSPSRQALAVGAALALALGARIPGVFWGDNFPGGFHGNHVDEWTHVVLAEALLDPKSPPRWHPNPYPKGLAAHVAVPLLAGQRIEGRDFAARPETRSRIVPPDRTLILFGRAWSVLYGALTVLVLFALARRLTGSPRTAALAAFLLALGGLHVSQSHFFVADVPALFWTLLATHLLLVDLDERGSRPTALPWAAFAAGVAAGLKLSVHVVPSLVLVTFLFKGRWVRALQAAAFFVCGAVLVNFASFTPVDLVKTLSAGVASGTTYRTADVLRIYALELVASIGAPVVILAALGLGASLRAAFSRGAGRRAFAVAILALVPSAILVLAMARRLDPFPRHALPLFPWIILLAAVALDHVVERLRARPALAVAALVVVFGWQVALVVDGERNYATEPRNDAMRWIESRVPKGATVYWPAFESEIARRGLVAQRFPEDARPDFVVAEMHTLNHLLSGSGLRESYPADWRVAFDAQSNERLTAFQDLYRGRSGYAEAARFSEGYVMPELRLADRIVGNRSRNYLAEVVIFQRQQ